MDVDKLAKLRAIADKATPGDWSTAGGTVHCHNPPGGLYRGQITIVDGCTSDTGKQWAMDEDLRFIATFNPSVVKALLDVVEAAKTAREEIDKFYTHVEQERHVQTIHDGNHDLWFGRDEIDTALAALAGKIK